jgi:ribulose-5-phosphate 4-epimerase/fuculose-1-phosphate aldolase
MSSFIANSQQMTLCHSFVMFHFLFAARQANAVIHTHSKAAVMATLLYPGKEFRVTYLEMIKVILVDSVLSSMSSDMVTTKLPSHRR